MQGIYKITNTINGMVYIGQSKNIHKRWKAHKKNWKYNSSKLYDAIYTNGIDNFEFEIIEKVDNVVNLLSREKYWKDKYNSVDNGYNAYKGIETNENLWEFANNSKRRSNIIRNKRPIYKYPSKEELKSYDKELKQYHIDYKQYRLDKLLCKPNIKSPHKPIKPKPEIINERRLQQKIIVHYPPRKGKGVIDKEIVYG
jgi:group I intron endonuclease